MCAYLAASDFLLQNGIQLALALGVFGLLVAGVLIFQIKNAPAGNARMAEVAAAIQEGAAAYLKRQLVAVGIIAVIITLLLAAWKQTMAVPAGFVVGAVCSLVAGFIGMRIAVLANVRTTQAATESEPKALRVAFNGGAVTGLLVVGLALLSVGIFFNVMRGTSTEHAVDSLVGLALGSSLISVFARLGGGIYTKAADVGADLVGKIEQNLQEDDPRNPATIADNVGDNVGDCAGMAADVFETYAVSLIGGVLVGYLTAANHAAQALIYPFVICGVSIIGALLGILFVNLAKISATRALIGSVVMSGIVSAALLWPITGALFPEALDFSGKSVDAGAIFTCVLVGIVLTFAAVGITNYFTSTNCAPVRRLAEACKTGHATNIIAGISTGHHATVLPVLCIVGSIWLCHSEAGLYGIAVAVVSMLSLSGIIISLDAFGPITDNAGGIAVMSGLDPSVRKITDELDAVGNTMKAVTKGYAIASAGLAAMVLFGSYVEELRAHLPNQEFVFDLTDPRIIIGLFIGGLLPFSFTAYAMDAVGSAAGAVVREVRRQIQAHPGILDGTQTPDYGQCVDIVTKAALRQMILPALLPLVFVVAVAMIPALGAVALGGVLVGTIVTGLFIGIAMTSSGGAWDNAKKFIEDGNHGGKGSPAHAASVTGDTVGDPYKDTAGPAVNPMIKVVNILAILIIPILFN